jgi:hypothetical protein
MQPIDRMERNRQLKLLKNCRSHGSINWGKSLKRLLDKFWDMSKSGLTTRLLDDEVTLIANRNAFFFTLKELSRILENPMLMS